MEIAVTTPTGNVGAHLVHALLRAGVRPRVLVRDAARLDEEVRAACDVREVDQGDADGVLAATEGVDVLHWVCPSTQDDDPVAGYVRLGRSAADAVRRNGIGRVVFQSSIGAEARGGMGEIDGLGAVEELLDATGADVVHLRCGYFFTNLLMDPDSLESGRLTTTLPLDRAFGWVDPRDIAEVTAGRLLSTAWSGRVVQAVHGPQDLSFTDVAALLTDVLGRPVEAVAVTDDDVAAGLHAAGMTDAQVDAVVGMSRGQRDLVPEQARDVTTTTPSTLAGWAWEHLRPQRV